MAVQAQYLAYVLEQLDGLRNVRSRRMFSGVGLYSNELFFGLVHDDTLFFKTDESNQADYAMRNMPRFMPPSKRPLGPFGYHQVPAEVIEDGEQLVAWARRSVAVALAARARKGVGGKTRPKGNTERRAKVKRNVKRKAKAALKVRAIRK